MSSDSELEASLLTPFLYKCSEGCYPGSRAHHDDRMARVSGQSKLGVTTDEDGSRLVKLEPVMKICCADTSALHTQSGVTHNSGGHTGNVTVLPKERLHNFPKRRFCP